MNKKSVGFFLLTIPFLILGRKLIKSDYWSRSLYLLIVGIFCTLVLCSIVHSIIRIPLLVQISPYRIGLFSVLLTFLLIIQLLVPWINRLKLSLPFKINFSWHVIGTLITLTGLSLILRDEFHQEQFSPSKMELINWIKGQTNSHDLFLDYANVDVRTNCKRSSYFEFKTISLTANTQIDWYQRFLKYNNFTGMIHPRDLSEKIKEDSGPVIQTFGVAGKNKFDVLTNIRDHITYVITYADDSLTLDKGKPVFQNENYLVFKSKE